MRYNGVYIIIVFILFAKIAAGGVLDLYQSGEIEPVEYTQFVITNVTPIEFFPSDIKNINITIKNIFGYSAFDVSTEVDSNKSEPIKFTQELKKSIAGEIGPKQSITVQYEVYIKDNTPKGTFYIPLVIQWSNVIDGTVKRQEDLYIGIKVVENPEANRIEITDIILPDHIYSGDDFKLKVVMKNIGKDKLSTIKTSISFPQSFASKNSSTEKYIMDLQPNQSAETEFDLYVDKLALSRVYNFNSTVEYKDILNRPISQQSNFGVLVEELPQAYIHDIVVDPPTSEPGEKGLLTMQLTNTGTNEIKNIKIAIKGGDGILTQSENFIGQIGPKKSTALSYGIYIDPYLKPGVYGLSIQVSYDDMNGNNYQSSYLFPTSIITIPLLPISSDFLLVLACVFLYLIFINIVFIFKGRRIEKKMKG